ncbi:MAG: glycine cleavage system aminomethyltransferase GcvT [Beijerinckiaceae bacterium]|jgi:aminomethyltransferase|nr:glycine cleavage system aminomethyltransferase GcvT [Beijerinckiaceae bacterium]
MTDAKPDPHSEPDAPLALTPLHALHRELGAKMAPFAGYDMPIHYPAGILAEHLHARAAAGLFDVSHMGQAFLTGPDAVRHFETLVPGDMCALAEDRIRYTQFLNRDGGILDDLMATRWPGSQSGEERLFLVVNAARKAHDFAHVTARSPELALVAVTDRALLALQGPKAADVLSRILPGLADQPFMSMRRVAHEGAELYVSRSGYTGEDGYEISLPGALAEAFARRLLADPDVKPVGLGARDSLRLEAGLCLYGHDIDESTTPVEADLLWSISKRRRAEGGFPGASRVQRQIAEGPARRRVGLALDGKAPAREGAEIVSPDGAPLGRVTSGGFAPSLGRPVAMGYVDAAFASPGARVDLLVRGRPLAATVVPMPFVPTRYYRGK